ncbi:MAG: CoB--CoM heterodisulfide reductase iron-sulfur subunit A family protein, partial [Gemmatimonadota bacterium]
MEHVVMGEARVGVIICRCGDEIGGVLDVDRLVKAAKKIPHVQYVTSELYPCSKDSLATMKRVISEHNLDRIVVAGCTPRTHAQLFRNAFQEAGLNGNLVEMVNIREHCSWVHAGERRRATKKGVDLIRMGVARVTHARPQEKIQGTVQRSAVVIGGGISGMTAALSLAQKDVPVKLVEKKNRLGGLVHDMYLLYPTYTDSKEFIEDRIKAVDENPNIEVFLSSQVTDASGHVGDYSVTIEKDGEEQTLPAGVIVVATGSDVFEPVGMFGYGDDPRVVTQLAFEAMMRSGDIKAQNIVMIQCVGARIDERPYCSRHCCLATIMNAITLKEKAPDKNI